MLVIATVPCLRFEYTSETEKRAYLLADNKLALIAGWDADSLTAELGALLESPDLDFDIDITVFSLAEIDLCLEGGIARGAGWHGLCVEQGTVWLP